MPSPFTVRAPRHRLDYRAIKDQVDVATVAEALLGPPAGRGGSRGLWWRCPFHDDRNPSFHVGPDRRRWKCFGCGVGGDAADLVERRESLIFPDAVRRVAELCGLVVPSGEYRPSTRPKPVKAPERPAKGPTGLPRPDAERIALEAAERLWRPEGRAALSYLHDRGLEDATIKAARLGYVHRTMVPRKNKGPFPVSGVAIPRFDGGRLARINVRLLPPWRTSDGRETRYANAFLDRPTVYPGPEAIRAGTPLVVVEGELDRLLLHQEIGDFACVLTFGSATSPVDPAALAAAIACPSWYAAHDDDDAGEGAAAKWLNFGWCVRVKPPGESKDWTDAHALGANVVRDHWSAIVKPPGPSRETLETRRRGRPDDGPEDLGCVAEGPSLGDEPDAAHAEPSPPPSPRPPFAFADPRKAIFIEGDRPF